MAERPGRLGRPRSTRAQSAILEAAGRLFAAGGFSGTSVRDIAAAAQVDPSIVIRHFTSKESLFLQTMRVDEGFRGMVDGPTESLGHHILQQLTAEDDGRARVFAALVGALDRKDVRDYIEQSAQRHIVGPLIERLNGPDRELRARLVAAQILGLLTVLWVLDEPGLVSAPRSLVHATYARALQVLIDDAPDVTSTPQPDHQE